MEFSVTALVIFQFSRENTDFYFIPKGRSEVEFDFEISGKINTLRSTLKVLLCCPLLDIA
jgi:hypothetical protein